MTDKKCRLCRREGIKLFLKGERCFSPKCPIDRRGAVPPGVHGAKRTRGRHSEHSQQLREKQKLRRLYHLDEKQFKNYFFKAKKTKGETAESLVKLLESRLDNVVFRLGFVPSRLSARQLVNHGQITVNGKRVDIASYLVKSGDTIALSVRGLKMPIVTDTLAKKEALPEWLERKAAVGRVKRLPKGEEIDVNLNAQAVVEYYSK